MLTHHLQIIILQTHYSRVQNEDWDLRLRDQQMPVVNGSPFVFMRAISDRLMLPDACDGSKGEWLWR